MRTSLVPAALVAALLATGCGASASTGEDADTQATTTAPTFSAADVGFTFEHPASFVHKKVDADNTQGTVRALLGIDDNNVIAIRQFAPTALATPAKVRDATVSFATQNGVAASAVRSAEHSGIPMSTFDAATTVDGTNTANQEWVFSVGGATWQLECQSTPDKAAEVRAACEQALHSIKAK